jgi:hypothetical protein
LISLFQQYLLTKNIADDDDYDPSAQVEKRMNELGLDLKKEHQKPITVGRPTSASAGGSSEGGKSKKR